MPAPAYWTRYRVETDEAVLGRIEKRGGFAPWTVLDDLGAYVGSAKTRAEAVTRLKNYHRPADLRSEQVHGMIALSNPATTTEGDPIMAYTTTPTGRRLAVVSETGTDLKTFGSKTEAAEYLAHVEGLAVVVRKTGMVVRTQDGEQTNLHIDDLIAAGKPKAKAPAPAKALTVRATGRACTVCGSPDKQSNGQCACRNVLYRSTRNLGFSEADILAGSKVYDEAITQGETPIEARRLMREAVPALAPTGRVKKA